MNLVVAYRQDKAQELLKFLELDPEEWEAVGVGAPVYSTPKKVLIHSYFMPFNKKFWDWFTMCGLIRAEVRIHD